MKYKFIKEWNIIFKKPQILKINIETGFQVKNKCNTHIDKRIIMLEKNNHEKKYTEEN